MLNKSTHIIYEKNKYKDDKIDLFYDYTNSNDLGNLKAENNSKYFYSDNKFYSPIQNNYNNYSINNNYFNSYTEKNVDQIKDKETDKDIDIDLDLVKEKEDIYKDLNLSFKSNTLKKYIQTKKESFDKLSSSINNIINKYNDKEDNSNAICKNENKNKKKNGINTINNNNLNKIVEHLIKAYSKDELKLIKDKLDNEVDEEEEPQPEKLNFIQHIYKRNKLKLSSDSPSFLKSNNNKNTKINLGNKNFNDKNKNKYFKKINKCIIYKPIKINNTNASNSKNFKKNDNNINKYFSYESNKNNKSNNIKAKPEFYTYIQCKTSFDCIDNFLKRQKQYRSYTENKKNDLTLNKNYIENKKHTFNPNTSYTSNSKYSIKLQAQRLNESNVSKINRIICSSAEKNSKNNKLKYSKTFSFTPNINKNNKIYKKLTSDYNMIKNRFKIETNKELTPVKYVNHRFDHVKSIYKNDGGLFKRIKEQNQKKIEKVEKLKIENEYKEMEGCTFKPDMSMSKTRNKSPSASKYLRNNSNKNPIHNEEKKNKDFRYIDFYEYKKKHKNLNKKK